MKAKEKEEILVKFEELGYLTETECSYLSSRTMLPKITRMLTDSFGSVVESMGTFKLVDTYAVFDSERVEHDHIRSLINEIASDSKQLEC